MGIRERIHLVIFEAESGPGRWFDHVLIASILISVAIVVADSVAAVHAVAGGIFYWVEWFFTILFTCEYVLRVATVRRPLSYVFSFYGLVDLLSVLPTWLTLFIGGTHSLLVVRVLRLLRIFRVLKLIKFIGPQEQLSIALRESRAKITVFLVAVLALDLVVGATMYLIEGPENGFTSIPRAMYWAIVTMTTVGYGDMAPATTAGRFFASLVMVMGYGIIAVPTGVVTVQLSRAMERRSNTRTCPGCCLEGHAPEALYCRVCGVSLNEPEPLSEGSSP